ncbi:MAG: T9SS type A sorting domain-containing protein [Chitinophagaceae bacterium]|nr:T9SS type A sorting domain-containing protein [Chitinophagaceae bacterium]
MAECCSKDALFELEKSSDSRNFVLLSSISGSETNKFYFYNDSRLGKGITYYRLKMTDTDGSVKYSKVIAIINDEKGFVITSIAPNPVQHAASLTISAAKQSSVKFKVYDMTGNLVKQWQSSVAGGINVVNMDVSALANGTYHVLASSLDDKNCVPFYKTVSIISF